MKTLLILAALLCSGCAAVCMNCVQFNSVDAFTIESPKVEQK